MKSYDQCQAGLNRAANLLVGSRVNRRGGLASDRNQRYISWIEEANREHREKSIQRPQVRIEPPPQDQWNEVEPDTGTERGIVEISNNVNLEID